MHKNGTLAFERRLDALKDSVRHLVDAGGERASHIKDKAIDVKDSTRDFIREHPIAAIAIAFGVGYAVFRLARR